MLDKYNRESTHTDKLEKHEKVRSRTSQSYSHDGMEVTIIHWLLDVQSPLKFKPKTFDLLLTIFDPDPNIKKKIMKTWKRRK